jgi:hypothetical protein
MFDGTATGTGAEPDFLPKRNHLQQKKLTLSFVDLNLSSGLDLLERFETLAITRLGLVLGEVKALYTLIRVVVVAPPAPQVVEACTARRWYRLRQKVVLLPRLIVLLL